MPEIGEVARIVHFIRQHLAGRTIRSVTATADDSVYGKVGTSADAVKKALTGRKIVDGKQQGKYFWIELDKSPHLLMHFGMAGWFHIKGVNTGYREAGQEGKPETDWPPKYMKFNLEMDDGTEAAFVDFRRFARIRLVDAKAEDMRKTTPLKENGPDPVVDKELVTVEWLADLCAKKKAPIKAVILDQANVSGVGNWVSDEIFYDAKMHPEQYSNTLSEAQIKQLHKSLHYVCGLACEVLADSSKFPDTWLFKYRWGKGKKDAPKKLPNGEKIEYLTVGGRTSAIIPSVQKKTGPVKADIDGKAVKKEDAKPAKGGRKRKQTPEDEEADEEDESKPMPVKAGRGKKVKTETGSDATNGKAKTPSKSVAATKETAKTPAAEDNSGRRRSTRVSNAGK